MQKMTLKNYAVKEKISFFTAMKLVKSGKVKSTVEEVNGNEVTYILLEDKENNATVKEKKRIEENFDFDVEKEVKKLMMEVETLKAEIEKLKKS